MLLLVCCVASKGPATEQSGVFTINKISESIVLTTAQRGSLQFQFGPPDGTIGVVKEGEAYTFFMPAASSASCKGTPSTGGTYRFGGSLASFRAIHGCSAALSSRQGADPNGYTFDRDYAEGGPVLAVHSASGAAGLLHIYHGEWQGGRCSGLGKCFYSSLGLALSNDGGASFAKLGEIVQPFVTRSTVINANENFDVGGGTLLIADGEGRHIANLASADTASTYLYVFYTDFDPSAAASGSCSSDACLAVARAPLAAVIANAFDGKSATFPTLFKKFYQGGFTEPGTGGDPNDAVNSGHYTPVIAAAGNFPSAIFDESAQQYLIAYSTDNSAIEFQHGSTLLSWSGPIASATITSRGKSVLYPTLIGEGDDPATGNGHPWLFYVTASHWPDWKGVNVMRRGLKIAYSDRIGAR